MRPLLIEHDARFRSLLRHHVSCEWPDAEFVSYSHSGVGYFLTVRHHLLPKPRKVLSEPIVLGQAGTVVGSYLVFLQDNQLMLEYASTTAVPEDFRDLPVLVVAQGAAT
jgi:hypothetical protein